MSIQSDLSSSSLSLSSPSSSSSSRSAVPVGVGNHVPPRLSVLSYHNQADPLASSRLFSWPVPDLFSLSSHVTIRPISLPPPIYFPGPSQIFSLCPLMSQSGRSPCLLPSIFLARPRSFLSVLSCHNQADLLASSRLFSWPVPDLFSLSCHVTIRPIPLPLPVYFPGPSQIFSLCPPLALFRFIKV